jgi:hypothetical protein
MTIITSPEVLALVLSELGRRPQLAIGLLGVHTD